MRVTVHSGKLDKNGKPFSAKHNDRNFDVSKADHIDMSLSYKNEYLYLDEPANTFEEQEQMFYEKHFSDYIESKNLKAKANYQKDRMTTVENYRNSKLGSPQEVLIQFGNVNDNVDKRVLKKALNEFVEWHRQQFPNVKLLNAAIHCDEPNAATHCHVRQVWVGHRDGREFVSQTNALEELGIERPFPNKAKSRTNNASITYTNMCRSKMQEIGKSYGLQIEFEPKQASKTGLSLLDLKKRTAEEKLAETKLQEQVAGDNVKLFTNEILANVKPERKLFRKTENYVIDKQEYEALQEIGVVIRTGVDKIIKDNQHTDEQLKEIEDKQRAVEKSYNAHQLELQQLVNAELERLHKAELENIKKSQEMLERAKQKELQAEMKLQKAQQVIENLKVPEKSDDKLRQFLKIKYPTAIKEYDTQRMNAVMSKIDDKASNKSVRKNDIGLTL